MIIMASVRYICRLTWFLSNQWTGLKTFIRVEWKRRIFLKWEIPSALLHVVCMLHVVYTYDIYSLFYRWSPLSRLKLKAWVVNSYLLFLEEATSDSHSKTERRKRSLHELDKQVCNGRSSARFASVTIVVQLRHYYYSYRPMPTESGYLLWKPYKNNVQWQGHMFVW